MLAEYAKTGRQPWGLIAPQYNLDVYAQVYKSSFQPMVHDHYWASYDGPKLISNPIRRREAMPEHPKK